MESGVQPQYDPRRIFAVLWWVFFFHGMAPGLWLPAITNILNARGLSGWVTAVFLVPPLCSLIAPLVGGAMADQRVSANRLFVWTTAAAAMVLVLAFAALDAGWHPIWFVALLGVHSIASGPSWGLLATVSLAHLPHGERRYPLVRAGATVGWIAGGLVTSFLLRADTSLLAGYVAAVPRLIAVGMGILLPFTPPLGRAAAGWLDRLGFQAFGLLRHRDHAVFFAVTTVFSIPLAALYMYSPEFLRVLGDPRPTGTMTIAQVLEVVSMLLVGSMMSRYRVKTMLLWALGLSAMRYGLSGLAGLGWGIGWHIGGIAFHGVCYTFYFITSQVFLDRRVDPSLRGQAQGLLSMVANGIGPLLGAFVCGWLHDVVVRDDGSGWDQFWLLLGGIIAGCFVAFALLYKGLPDSRQAEAMPKV